MANEHIYRLLHKVEVPPDGLRVDEAYDKSKEGYGACDAILLASIIYPADGSLSVQFVSADGRTGKLEDLADNEWFKIWGMLASRLARSQTLDANKKELADIVWQTICRAVAGPPKPHAPGRKNRTRG